MQELLKALIKAKQGFETITKSKAVYTNNKKLMYRYANLDDILAAIEPSLLKNDLVISQILSNGADNKLQITTRLYHASGELLESVVDVNNSANPQQAGSNITYFKRYAISALLSISTDEDIDGNTEHPLNNADPKDYVITFGMHKNKKLGDITKQQARDTYAWCVKVAKEKGKAPDGAFADYMMMCERLFPKEQGGAQSQTNGQQVASNGQGS